MEHSFSGRHSDTFGHGEQLRFGIEGNVGQTIGGQFVSGSTMGQQGTSNILIKKLVPLEATLPMPK